MISSSTLNAPFIEYLLGLKHTSDLEWNSYKRSIAINAAKNVQLLVLIVKVSGSSCYDISLQNLDQTKNGFLIWAAAEQSSFFSFQRS